MREVWSCNVTASVLTFSPNGKVLIAGAFDGLTVLDGDTGTPLGPPLAGGVEVRGVQFSADGSHFLAVAASWAGLWRTSDFELVWMEKGPFHWAAISPCGKRAGLVIPGQTFRLRIRQPEQSLEVEIPFWRRPRGIAATRDRFAIACEDGLWLMDWQGRLEQAVPGCCMGVVAASSHEVWALDTGHVRLFPSGPRIPCGPGYLRLQPWSEGQLLLSSPIGAYPTGRAQVLHGPTIELEGLYNASVSPDGSRLAISNSMEEVWLYQVSEGTLIGRAQAVGRTLAWRTSDQLAAASNAVRLWQL